MASDSTPFDGTDRSPSVDGAFDAIRGLVADLRDQARKDSKRADAVEMMLLSTERELARAREMSEQAREQANSIVENARREAEAIAAEARSGAQAMRAGATAREEEIVEAMRSYLREIEESQSTLLRIARRALSALAALGPTSDPRQTVYRPDSPVERGSSASETDRQSGQREEWAPPGSLSSDPSTPPVARARRVKVPRKDADDQVVFAGSASPAELTTDEHRLIDVSNQRDLDRLDAPLSVRNLLRGL